jgi:hypothetical protein
VPIKTDPKSEGGPAKVAETPPTEDTTTPTEPVEDQAPDVKPDMSGFVFVTFPDGTLHAVDRKEVERANAASSLPAAPVIDETGNEDVYVALSDGTSHKVKRHELPGYAGTNAPYGFWSVDGADYTITNVYPA